MASIIGLIAALLTTAAFVPQALRTIKTRSTKDLALSTYSMMTAGTFLWFIYGFWVKDWPLILANAITFLLTATILYYKLTEKKDA